MTGLLIGRDPERRILRGKLCQRDVELFPVGLRFRLDCDLDQRLAADVVDHRSVSNLMAG
jgi:hypothetical protein